MSARHFTGCVWTPTHRVRDTWLELRRFGGQSKMWEIDPQGGGPHANERRTIPARIQGGSCPPVPLFGQISLEGGRGNRDIQRVFATLESTGQYRCGRAQRPHYRRAGGVEQAPPGSENPPPGARVPEILKKPRCFLRQREWDTVSAFKLIEAERASFSVPLMCSLLGVSRSGYYVWRDRVPSRRSKVDAALTERIKAIHERSRGTYGAPRVHAELRLGEGVHRGRKRVARLMRKASISGCRRGGKSCTTTSKPERMPFSPDLVEQLHPRIANLRQALGGGYNVSWKLGGLDVRGYVGTWRLSWAPTQGGWSAGRSFARTTSERSWSSTR